MKIGMANDHRGYKLKIKLLKYLKRKGHSVTDYGSDNKTSVDYPDFAFKLGEGIKNKKIDFGIAICASGIGISIACNKVKGVRCARVTNNKEAKIARRHNDANVIALSGKTILFEAKDAIDVFLKTKFDNKERLIRRNKKLEEYEENNGNI